MPAETETPAPYAGQLVAVCHECSPLKVIDDQGNCHCGQEPPTLRHAYLGRREDWAAACPNPGDPSLLSSKHGVIFENLYEHPDVDLPGPVTWKTPAQAEPGTREVHCGGRVWAQRYDQHARSPYLEQLYGRRYRLELTPPPKILTDLTEKEAKAIAEAYANLLDAIFTNR